MPDENEEAEQSEPFHAWTPGQPIGQTWERLYGEPARAYAAFVRYRDMDPGDRSVHKAYRQFYRNQAAAAGKPPPDEDELKQRDPRHWSKYCSSWDWVMRAQAFDQYNERIREEARVQELNVQVRELERRRGELRIRRLEAADKLLTRANDMLALDLVRQYTRDGLTIIEPTRWVESDITRHLQLMAQFQDEATKGVLDEVSRHIITTFATGAEGGTADISAEDEEAEAEREFQRALDLAEAIRYIRSHPDGPGDGEGAEALREEVGEASPD